MGKKRIITKKDESSGQDGKEHSSGKSSKKKITSGSLYIQSTYNNTLITLSDQKGNVVLWSTSGSIGFKGAKKGTPFASSKVVDLLLEKAKNLGLNDVDVIVRGVGAGRESAIRAVAAKGIGINSIQDRTPIPHNGPKPRKPRRV